MKNTNFKINNKIISIYFKIYWKINLFFTLLWFFITLLGILTIYFLNLNSFKYPIIGKSSITISQNKIYLYSLSDFLNYFLYSGFGICFFSIFILMNFNKIIFREFSNNTIEMWRCLPLNKNNIFFGKFYYILYMCLLVFLPSFIIMLIFSAFSYDFNQYFGYVFLYGIEFVSIIFLLLIIYWLIINLLIEKWILINIIIFLIISYLTFSTSLLNILDPDYSAGSFSVILRYTSITTLLVSPLYFDTLQNKKIILDNNTILILYKNIQFVIRIIVCDFLMMFFFLILFYLNKKLINKKIFNN